MSLHLVFPDATANFMPFSFEYLQPAQYFEREHGGNFCYQKDFFANICSSLTRDDTVILFIDCKDEENIEKLADCKARKFLRSVDPSKSDMALYKNQLSLHDKVGFEAFGICYPNKDHISFLESQNVKVIVWPHLLDFKDSQDKFIKGYLPGGSTYICAGQQHEQYYPDRWKLSNILLNCFPEDGILLPHPGFELDNLRHPYVGEKFLNLLENFWIMPVGVGINDGLHMKFVEAAYANMLPIGLMPSYIPKEIAELVPFNSLDPSDYVVEEIIETLRELFADPRALIANIRLYKIYFKREHNLPTVLQRVAKEILE